MKFQLIVYYSQPKVEIFSNSCHPCSDFLHHQPLDKLKKCQAPKAKTERTFSHRLVTGGIPSWCQILVVKNGFVGSYVRRMKVWELLQCASQKYLKSFMGLCFELLPHRFWDSLMEVWWILWNLVHCWWSGSDDVSHPNNSACCVQPSSNEPKSCTNLLTTTLPQWHTTSNVASV